ncbi:MAG: peroxiredoxin family protein [Blastocatellia bacterium]
MNRKFALLAVTTLALSISIGLAQTSSVSMRTLDGDSFSLEAQRGKVVVLAFGATWVPLSAKELPALQKFADKYNGRNVEFYWVSINSLKQGGRSFAADTDLKAFATKHGLKMPILRDPDQAAYKSMGVESLPTVLIIDRAGKISHRQTGFDPDQADGYGEAAQALDKLLK